MLCSFFGDKDGAVKLGVSKDSIKFERAGNKSVQFKCESDKHIDHYEALGAHEEYGTTVKTWVVQAYIDGKLVAWRASDGGEKLELLAKRDMHETK